MEETYFQSFLKLLDNALVLKESTAIGVMVDFKMYINEIKSEVLAEIQTKGESRNDYLDFLINEIEKQHYVKNADISYVQKWLDEYKISIDDILDMKYQNNAIRAVVDSHYMDMDKFSAEKDKALLLQSDFRDFFCKYFADELITFLNSKKENVQNNNLTIQSLPMKAFKDEYLNAFCKEISNERDIYQSTFIQCYDFGIKGFIEFLKSEITENLLILPLEKINPYLDFVEDKIKKTPYFDIDNNIVDRWISKYGLENFAFPYIENKEVNKLISMSVNFHQLTEDYRTLMEDIQIDFYCYAAMIEANKMIDFLESKKTNTTKMTNKIEKSDETENANQLSVNQAIILLDKLGVFSTDTFENKPNTKKAKLISQLLGKNEKNIKTSIEKLELKQSELGAGYQRDLDKIQQLLNNLE